MAINEKTDVDALDGSDTGSESEPPVQSKSTQEVEFQMVRVDTDKSG